MKDKKYKVCRDSIYVGEVIECTDIYKIEDEMDSRLLIGPYYSLRSILFVLNNNGSSNDLIYKSPEYPVLNISDENFCMNSSIIIRDAFNMGELLEYLGYDKYLTYADIIKIRKSLFNGSFAKTHCELFGYKEITTPESESRVFVTKDRSILDRRYFDVLNARGDNFWGFLFADGKINPFKPVKKEGHVKKLKRY